jgi:hypothetical protein
MHDLTWSKREKQIARAAFDQALARESAALIELVRAKAQEIKDLDDVWRLEKLLGEQGRALERRYDYRYSRLLFVFADLILAGWLSLDELAGLDDNKLARIAASVEFARRA